MYTICNYNTYSAGMKERCRDGCRTSLLIAGVVLVPAIFHTLLPPCHPYITIHFMEMIFSTCKSTAEPDKRIYSLHCKCVSDLSKYCVHLLGKEGLDPVRGGFPISNYTEL